MTEIRFQSLERFLYYVQKKEGIIQETERNCIKAECLKADAWEQLKKILPTADYYELTKNKNKIEIRSFCIPDKIGQLIFYAVGKEDETGAYLCKGYGIVDETARKDKKAALCE